jgi:nucleotide-binding universal stress UspA family protein
MRVLLALDGSEMSEAAIRAVGPWFSELGCEAVLLTVLDPDRLHQTYERRQLRDHSSGRTFRNAAAIATGDQTHRGGPGQRSSGRGRTLRVSRILCGSIPQGCHCEALVEWTDQAAEGILAAADRERADLIVVGTHGRSGLSRLVMGSVAEEW